MARKHQRALAITVAILMAMGPATMLGVPVSGNYPSDDGGRGPSASGEPWTDPLDDMSNVYVPPGGLVGIVDENGQARLKAGETDGWIASSVIVPDEGVRYNLAYIEAKTPGNSSIAVSILNASDESSEVGFANETISPFKKVERTDVSLIGISPTLYPRIRIQVNLKADGTNLPTMESWSLYFSTRDEWRDEFLGTAKMSKESRINITDGQVEINQSGKGAPLVPLSIKRSHRYSSRGVVAQIIRQHMCTMRAAQGTTMSASSTIRA